MIKSHRAPDETVRFERGFSELVTVGPLTISREVLEPGWRWSTHVKPIVRTERCEFHHVALVISGRMAIESRDGELREVGAGDVYDVAPGHDAWVVGDEPFVEATFQGIAGWAKAPDAGERILTTMLFTDIIGSTVLAERLGDRPWKQLLTSHREDVRSLLERHRGREIDTTGDGFLAIFDGPARAIACALAIHASARNLGIETRAGIHTGEVELADRDIRGLAVHLAARIMDAAGPGEVFVSSTSRELASGAGVEFLDRGTRLLKGISGERQLYEVRTSDGATPD
ncbi:MAG: adenylate/guanylate cyclase domain-containing protein [Chloroflexota bacterium]